MNRFKPSTKLSEWNYLRVIFAWLSGFEYSKIPAEIYKESKIFERFIDTLNSTGIAGGNIVHTEPQSITRQTCSNLVQFAGWVLVDRIRFNRTTSRANTIASEVFKGERTPIYEQRREANERIHWHLDSIDGSEEKSFARERVDELMRVRAELPAMDDWSPDDERLMIERRQLFDHFVYSLASQRMDDEHLRQMYKISSYDVLYHPHILSLLRDRWRRFQGFHLKRMISHTGYFFGIVHGLNFAEQIFNDIPNDRVSPLQDVDFVQLRLKIGFASALWAASEFEMIFNDHRGDGGES